LGGVSFPLLADFHPKGEVARSYGLYLEKNGITDRATVLIDAEGVVKYQNSVTPSGERDVEELLGRCEELNAQYRGPRAEPPRPEPLPKEMKVYLKSNCGFSRSVSLALANLHLSSVCPVINVTENASAMAELKKVTGKEQAPCLLLGREPVLESADIVRYLVQHVAPL